MKSTKAKVLHRVASRTPARAHAQAVHAADIADVVVVVRHQREAVAEYLATVAPTTRTAVQAQMRGTGDAVRQALPQFGRTRTRSWCWQVTCPLLTGATLSSLIMSTAVGRGSHAGMLTAQMPDPHRLRAHRARRPRRSPGVVEHRDAADEQLGIDGGSAVGCTCSYQTPCAMVCRTSRKTITRRARNI